MVYADRQFNDSGKIPTDSNFWDQPIERFVSGDTIITAFSKVIGEQFFMPIKTPTLPMYNRFAGGSLRAGAGFTERIVCKNASKHYKPKASASDALSFYDTDGIERTYAVNVAGWRPITIPSDLATFDEFVNGSDIEKLNSYIYDNNVLNYQRDIESIIQKYVSSTIKNKVEIDYDSTDYPALIMSISEIANDIMGEKTAYNEMTDAENLTFYHGADMGVYAFIDKTLYDKIMSSKAYLPNPDRIIENVEFIPMIDGIATPITTAEWTAGPNTGLEWDNKPVAIDENKPDIILCDKRKFEYKPVRGSYRVTTNINGAGDFTNFHLLYKACMVNRPWYNGVRVELSDVNADAEPTPEPDDNNS